MLGTYGPASQAPMSDNSSGNAADPSDPMPHITRSSGGAGVEGTYGPGFSLTNSTAGSIKHSSSKEDSIIIKAAQQEGVTGRAQQQQEESTPTGDGLPTGPGSDAGLRAEANLPDPMVAADDGSQSHEAASDLQGRIEVSADNGGSPRSKL